MCESSLVKLLFLSSAMDARSQIMNNYKSKIILKKHREPYSHEVLFKSEAKRKKQVTFPVIAHGKEIISKVKSGSAQYTLQLAAAESIILPLYCRDSL